MPSYVNSVATWGFFTTMTISVPSGAAVGDVLVAATGRDRSGSGALPSGWTELSGSPFGFSRFAYRVIDGTEAASYVFGDNASSWAGIMMLYRGGAVGASGQFNSTTMAVIRAPSVTSVAANALLVNHWFQNTFSATWTYPGSTTVRHTIYGGTGTGGFAPKIGLGDEVLASAGASGVRDVALAGAAPNHAGFSLVLEDAPSGQPMAMRGVQVPHLAGRQWAPGR